MKYYIGLVIFAAAVVLTRLAYNEGYNDGFNGYMHQLEGYFPVIEITSNMTLEPSVNLSFGSGGYINTTNSSSP